MVGTVARNPFLSPEEAQNTQLSLADGCGSLAKVYNECGGRQSRSWTRVAVGSHETPNIDEENISLS